MRHTFEDMGAQALTAGWFVDNPASGRVLQKLGFAPVGIIQCQCVSRGTKLTLEPHAVDAGRFYAKEGRMKRTQLSRRSAP